MAPRLTLTKQIASGSYPTLQPAANSLDLPMVATVVADKAEFVATGNDLIIWHNTGAAPHTVTITSVADPKNNRTGDVTQYSVGAGEYGSFGPIHRDGWVQSDGKVYLEADHIEVKFGVVALP